MKYIIAYEMNMETYTQAERMFYHSHYDTTEEARKKLKELVTEINTNVFIQMNDDTAFHRDQIKGFTIQEVEDDDVQ